VGRTGRHAPELESDDLVQVVLLMHVSTTSRDHTGYSTAGSWNWNWNASHNAGNIVYYRCARDQPNVCYVQTDIDGYAERVFLTYDDAMHYVRTSGRDGALNMLPLHMEGERV